MPNPGTHQHKPPLKAAMVADMFTVLFPTTAAQLNRIEQKVDTLMADVKIAQEQLDQFAADITESTDLIAQEIQALVDSSDNNLTEADVTNLQAAVDSLKGLEPPHPEQVS